MREIAQFATDVPADVTEKNYSRSETLHVMKYHLWPEGENCIVYDQWQEDE